VSFKNDTQPSVTTPRFRGRFPFFSREDNRSP
jgi:hypothetical protein